MRRKCRSEIRTETLENSELTCFVNFKFHSPAALKMQPVSRLPLVNPLRIDVGRLLRRIILKHGMKWEVLPKPPSPIKVYKGLRWCLFCDL